MALQNYTPMRLATAADPALRNELLKVDIFLRQLTPFAARVPVFPQGSTASSIDLTQFLFLPGRVPLQRAFGQVVFSTKSSDEAAVLDDSVFRGLTLVGQSDLGVQRTTHTVYFQPDDLAAANIVRKWIFPSLTGSATDTFTFLSTTGIQPVTNKTISSSTIIVGTNAGRNIFRSLDHSETKEFTLAPTADFPNTVSAQTIPTIQFPALDISVPTTDRHMLMMLHASVTRPFTIGSIAHGNFDGSEMEMLPAITTNGRALRWNNGESIGSCTWTTGTTTIGGAFTTANTRPGMRIRGDSGSSIYVDEATRIVTVTNGVSVTVDTPLVGNSVGTTCQTWGPTWDFELSGVDHGSLTGLTDDDHPQYLYLAGRAGAQVLGSGAHTGGLITDLTIEGRLMLGDGLTGVNYITGRVLDIRHQFTNSATLFSLQSTTGSPAGAASGTLRMFLAQPNSVGYTSGTYAFRGLDFLAVGILSPSGTTCSSATAINVQATPSEGGDPGSGGTFGVISSYRGINITVQAPAAAAARAISITTNSTTAITSAGLFVAPIAAGQLVTKSDIPVRTTLASITDASNAVLSQAATGSSTSSAGFTPFGTDLVAIRLLASAGVKPFPTASFIQFLAAPGGQNVHIDSANLFEVSTVPFNTVGVGTWSLIRMDSGPTLPVTSWIFNISATNNSRHAGNFTIGGTAIPTAKLFLGAGTTAASTAPLKFTSGTSMTTAEAGAVEFTTDDFFATITTGAARKAFVLDDGARLTSGKIPVATTNGRLVDLTASSAYTPTNVTTDRSYDANATTLDELADVVGTMIADLQAKGILG